MNLFPARNETCAVGMRRCVFMLKSLFSIICVSLLLTMASSGYSDEGETFIKASDLSKKSPDKAVAMLEDPFEFQALEPYRLLLKGQCLIRLQHYSEAVKVFQVLRKSFPRFRYSDRVETLMLESMVDAEMTEDLKIYIGSKRSSKYLYFLSKMDENSQERYLKKLMALSSSNYWVQIGSRDILRNLKNEFLGWNVDDRYKVGRARFEAGDYSGAFDIFEDLTKSSDARIKALSLYYAGRSAYSRRRYTEAISIFSKKVKAFPKDNNADSLWYLGSACTRKNQERNARKYFTELIDKYPSTNRARAAKIALAKQHRSNGETWLAINRLKSIIKDRSSSSYREDAYLESALCYLELSAFTRASELYSQFRRSYPNSSSVPYAYYWEAVCLKKLNRVEQAKVLISEMAKRFPANVYLIAAADLDLYKSIPHPRRRVESIKDRKIPVTEPDDDILKLGVVLARADLVSEANAELRAYASRSKKHREKASVVMYHQGFPSMSVALSWGLGGDMGKELRYPQAFREETLKHGLVFDIDPRFLWSIMREESRFRPAVKSRVGAIGLMQIMPATGREIARTLKISKFSKDMLSIPDVNIRMGASYITTVMNRFRDEKPELQMACALAGYNGGPRNASRWLKAAVKKPIDGGLGDFINSVTYSETRKYIHKVLGSYLEYLRRDGVLN